MGIGVSIFLLAVGAILAFALGDNEMGDLGVNLDVVGYILMAAGLVGLLLTLFLWGPRRRSSVEQRAVYDDGAPGGRVVEERRRYDDGGTAPPPAI